MCAASFISIAISASRERGITVRHYISSSYSCCRAITLELDAFLSKWDTIFRDNDYHQLGPVNEEEYVSELENLLKNAVVTR